MKNLINNHIVKILILIFLISNLFGSSNNINWSRRKIDNVDNLKIAKIYSEEKFWIYESYAGGKIFSCFQNEWQEFKTPEIENMENKKAQSFFILDDSTKLFSIVDEEYQTYFYYYDKKWKKCKTYSKFPVRYFISDSDNSGYFFGDWGEILYYSDKTITSINTPIQSHISAALKINNQKLIFGTQRGKIFQYENNNFNELHHNEFTQEITDFHLDEHNNLNVYLSNGNIYSYNGDKFAKNVGLEDSSNRLYYSILDDFSWLAYSINDEKLIIHKNEKELLEYIPSGDKIFSCQFVDNETIFCCTKNSILIGKFGNFLFFENFAGFYYLDGSKYDNSTGAGFIDLDNDFFPELFILNQGDNHYNRLFNNNQGTQFFDISSSLDLSQTASYNKFLFCDYNGDKYYDIIFIDQNNLKFFQNHKNEKFLQDSQKNINLNNYANLTDIDCFDFDKDFDSDLVFSSYFKNDNQIGSNSILENKFFGIFYRDTITLDKKSRGWNINTTCADFNNDGLTDIYISDRWGRDELLINQNAGFINQIGARIDYDFKGKVSTKCIVPADYDNDGDLDLVLIINDLDNLIFLDNNGDGYFEKANKCEKSDSLLVNLKVKFITTADFNNDGFIDIFTSSVNNKNYLFLNDSGRVFKLEKNVGIENISLNGAITADIDNDGDMDIFGLRDGVNYLWINNLNNKSYIKIKLSGVKTHIEGKHSKIWVYESGHLDDDNYLFGYKEVGVDNPANQLFNSQIAHFGLSKNKKYDVKINFYNGKKVVQKNVKLGRNIEISEYNGLAKSYFLIQPKIFYILRQKITYARLFSFIISVVIIIIGIQLGMRYFDWHNKIIILFLFWTISLFWGSQYLLSTSSFIYQFIIPVLVTCISVLIPVSSSFYLYYTKIASIKRNKKEDLLKILLRFDHGKLALSNINSLLLLCENVTNNDLSEKFLTQFENRKSTFIDIVAPNIKKIILFSEKTKDQKLLKESFGKLQNIIENGLLGKDLKMYASKMVVELFNLKKSLKQIKRVVFKTYSSNVENVINHVTDAYKEIFKQEKVTLFVKSVNCNNYWILIYNFELAEIIDNCFDNSLRALKDQSEKKKIQILITEIGPKVKLKISDNGKGIDEKMWESIFEVGFSGSNSTGRGLAHVKTLIEKYNGRIFVEESEKFKKTTITIEFLKGVKNEI